MLFMVIEQFRGQDGKSVYRHFRDKGRQMPEGLRFVSSYVTADLGRCFQLMECDDVTLLIEFEIVPVVAGKDTGAALAELL